MSSVSPTEPVGYRPYDPDPRIATGMPAGAHASAAPAGRANDAGTPSAPDAGSGHAALVAAIASRLERHRPIKRTRRVVAVDVYQSPCMDAFLDGLHAAWPSAHGPAEWIDTRAALKDAAVLADEAQLWLTDDPVFGRVCDRDLSMFFEPARWQALVERVQAAMTCDADGPVFVVGPGAMLSPLRTYTDVAVYAQVPREDIFFASERGVGRNLGDDRDRGRWGRYKRSFYVDWPVQNRHLFDVLPACDLLVDIRDGDAPTFADARRLRDGMARAATRPFRIRSIFFPGVWGGKRLQRFIPGLPQDWPNCAWGFEIIAPENTTTFDAAGTPVRTAFELFLHEQAAAILGADNHRRFGDYFPIRFDFLDTIDGGNLSCQVHPPDAYINSRFGEPFAQHEMYYILESRPGAKVYLGLTESTNRDAFLADVARAERERVPFDITRHVNAWDAERGDLFCIPAGTVHCSGANNLVLEISATPYIYTFKIYDYLRPDLNGVPRPISYARAFEVIDFSRTTPWVREHLLARPRVIDEGPGWRRELLVHQPLEFHSVERIELDGAADGGDRAASAAAPAGYADTTDDDGVHVLCVVEGDGARIVRQADGAALDATYGETIIVPGACGSYCIEPIGTRPVKLVKCYVRP